LTRLCLVEALVEWRLVGLAVSALGEKPHPTTPQLLRCATPQTPIQSGRRANAPTGASDRRLAITSERERDDDQATTSGL
jgi:hypothetical protein